MTPIETEAQRSATSAYVVLYQLDLRPFGGELLRLTSSSEAGGPIRFGGQPYAPVAIGATGFEWTAKGPPVSPTVTIADIKGEMTGLAETFGHPLGAKFTRIRTFARFLDSGAEPDPGQRMPLDIYRLEAVKEYVAGSHVSYELASWWSNEGRQLPRRVVLRDYCSRTYRRWAGEGFDYAQAQCPYTGAGCWDHKGAVCLPAQDQCGKRLADCKLRFGDDPRGLPTWAFPGMTRVR